jgi:hypothetical protein
MVCPKIEVLRPFCENIFLWRSRRTSRPPTGLRKGRKPSVSPAPREAGKASVKCRQSFSILFYRIKLSPIPVMSINFGMDLPVLKNPLDKNPMQLLHISNFFKIKALILIPFMLSLKIFLNIIPS